MTSPRDPITNTPPLGGEAPAGSIQMRTGDGAAADPGSAIFPIMKDNGENYELIGTGFFISTNGVFATAKHVLKDVIGRNNEQLAPIFMVHFLPENTAVLRPILRCCLHDQADVAVGVVAPMVHGTTKGPLRSKAVSLTRQLPQIGDRCSTYAYPNTVVHPPASIHFFPAFYMGAITESYPTGRDRFILPAPCFQTSMTIHGGASGGPVFGPDGKVFGINSTGVKGESGIEAISFVSRVVDLLPLVVEDVSIPGRSHASVTIQELSSLGFIPFAN